MASLGYINRKYDEKKFGKTNWICQDSRLKTYHLKPIVSVFFFSLYMSLKNNVFWCQILKKFMLIKADYVCTIWHTFLIKNCCMGILFSILYLCCKLSDIYMFKLICFITVGGIWHLPSLVNPVALVQQWQFYLHDYSDLCNESNFFHWIIRSLILLDPPKPFLRDCLKIANMFKMI